MSNYLNYRKYQTGSAFGFHTILVEPSSLESRRRKWSVRFIGSPVWNTGFKSKFDAILFASHKLGYSMEKLGWTPV